MDFVGLGRKAVRAAMLDESLYEEVEADEAATVEAGVVVVAASLLSGIGLVFTSGLLALITGTILALLSWVIMAAVTYFVGTKLFKGEADMGEMLRVLGFASAPRILGIIPWVGFLVGFIWTLVTTVMAVKEGLDFNPGKAIATTAIGFVVSMVVTLPLGLILGLM